MTTPPPRQRDETLAWIAVEERLRKHSERTFSGIMIKLFGGRGRAAAREAVSSLRVRSTSRPGMAPPPLTGRGSRSFRLPNPHMVRYSLAVDEMAKKMTDAERFTLRATGEVPDWFLAAVYRAAKRR